MKLHTIEYNGNRFCGPAIISLLTGMDTGESARVIRSVDPYLRAVKGTTPYQVVKALRKCGIVAIRKHVNKCTLSQWIRTRKHGQTYLVDAGQHWQIVSGDKYACGRLGITDISDKRIRRRTIVNGVYVLSGTPRKPIERLKPKPDFKAQSAKRKARSIAKEFGIHIEYADDLESWWVYPPDEYEELDEDQDPYTGCHECLEWSEVLEHVQTYADIIGKIKDK